MLKYILLHKINGGLVLKKLYCLVYRQDIERQNPNYDLLKQACRDRGIEFVELSIPVSGYTLADVPKLEAGGVYRLSTSNERVKQYLYALRIKNPKLNYWQNSQSKINSSGGIPWSADIRGELNNINIIPTIFSLTSIVNTDLLRFIKSHLGGFPVVLKQAGGSHGSNVSLINSAEELIDVLANQITTESIGAKSVLRKFIKNAKHYRVIVLNDKAISSIEYFQPVDDFRTNAVANPDVKPVKISPDIEHLAVTAVRNLRLLFGGVDILVDEDGRAYLAEVNTPCNFSRNQLTTGEDIAGQIVEFLCRI